MSTATSFIIPIVVLNCYLQKSAMVDDIKKTFFVIIMNCFGITGAKDAQTAG